MSARTKILDAYEAILIDEGERAATLERVAARAGVSKGGLLYHFGSKTALAEGLLGRLRELADADAAAMADDARGPSVYYLMTSIYADSPLDRALVAVGRLGADVAALAAEVLGTIQRNWYELIVAEVGDPAVAKAILLMADGLYYNASLQARADGGGAGVPLPAIGPISAPAANAAELLGVVETLKAGARASRP